MRQIISYFKSTINTLNKSYQRKLYTDKITRDIFVQAREIHCLYQIDMNTTESDI